MTEVYLNRLPPPHVTVASYEDPREAYGRVFHSNFNTTALYRAITLLDPELTCADSSDSSAGSSDYLMTWTCNAVDNQVRWLTYSSFQCTLVYKYITCISAGIQIFSKGRVLMCYLSKFPIVLRLPSISKHVKATASVGDQCLLKRVDLLSVEGFVTPDRALSLYAYLARSYSTISTAMGRHHWHFTRHVIWVC